MSAGLYISVDLDALGHHRHGYGLDAAASASDPVLETALPRFLELFGHLGVRATFFAVAQAAELQPARLQEARAAGHEIASHSYSHPLPFPSLSPAAVDEELRRSRESLEQILGAPVRGFRTPGLAVTPRVLDAVARAGYAYDSSLLASPFQVASLLGLAGYRSAPRSWLPHALRQVFASRRPHRLANGLLELPLSAAGPLRLPMYHTPRLVFGRYAFEALTPLRDGEPYLQYFFHGIDLLAPDEVDSALHRHPGVGRSLAEKTSLVEETVQRLRRGRSSRRLDEFDASSLPS